MKILEKNNLNKCQWCGYIKKNQFGICKKCHRFPSKKNINENATEISKEALVYGKLAKDWIEQAKKVEKINPTTNDDWLRIFMTLGNHFQAKYKNNQQTLKWLKNIRDYEEIPISNHDLQSIIMLNVISKQRPELNEKISSLIEIINAIESERLSKISKLQEYVIGKKVRYKNKIGYVREISNKQKSVLVEFVDKSKKRFFINKRSKNKTIEELSLHKIIRRVK